MLAAGRKQNGAFPTGLADQRRGVQCVTHIHEDALESGCALGLWHVTQLLQQARIVGGVTATGIAGGVYAGSAIQVVHFQARVIGDRGQPTVCGGGPRLDNRILDKTQAGFLHLGYVELGLRLQCDAKRCEHRA